MRIIVECNEKIITNWLPNEVLGNYWIVNKESKNLLNIEASNLKWLLKSNTDVKICKSFEGDELSNINYIDSVFLEENNFYYVNDIVANQKYKLYCLPGCENFENFVIDYSKIDNVIIGKNSSCDITVNNELFSEQQLSIDIDKTAGKVILKNLNINNKLFVNDILCSECFINNGDVIFVGGIYIYYFGVLILVSNNRNDIIYNSLKLNKRLIKENPINDYSDMIDKDVKMFSENDYFQRPPRFKRTVETKNIRIESPPAKQNPEETPFLFTLIPMLTMALMSFYRGFTSITKILDGESTFKKEFYSLLMCGTMLVTSLALPLVRNFYMKLKKKEKEKKRRKKYKEYVEKKREEIFKEINYQKQVLIEDNLPVETLRALIINKTRNLWERKFEHSDFLEFRLGIGTKKPDIDIDYPEEHFTLEEDDLKDIVTELVNESKDIVDVPITLNFRDNNKVGVIGNKQLVNDFFDSIMLQIMAYHAYDTLRIIIFTNDKNKSYWEKFKNIPYLWNNDKSIRYFASNKDDINKLTSFLMEELNYRKDEAKDQRQQINFIPYYLILTDDTAFIKNNMFVLEMLKSQYNFCYSIIMSVDKLDILPNECSMFISLSKDICGLFTNQMTLDNQIAFKRDIVNFSLRDCIISASNIPMDMNNGKFVLPRKYSFLEMFDVGNVKQLNIVNRWNNNNIVNSLETPVGIDEQGELFKIDLHEKAHGPHGLVAGMTGSGKSEWIITYILSMAVNYSPEEVQFVLIDYKGGGLALTFDNRENGVKLPHVVGTVTNLDAVEINRSLASITSELKRRQSVFKKAREDLNESSMDIYKYQDLYRAGKLKEPLSHLFIISDEFAELKAQQPEFMAELISAARIGRSLGVHLILATQKPSGVVNDQIWANSKFKVCLKVQDKSDSNEMLKRPDAAMLKDTGRFYFQVGYNEFFALGQSAYAGMPYYESDKKVETVDSSIDIVDDLGLYIKRGDIQKNNSNFIHKGDELPNVLNYIISISNQQKLNIRQLWLTRIPNVIYVDDLKDKYNYVKEDFVLNPVIGEYDNPSKQMQGLLTLPISQGNSILYGMVGSGKENFITTLIYSLISAYSVDEVNIYVVDLGSGVLNNFVSAPHMGGLLHLNDEEQLENLFKLVEKEIVIRREKCIAYNGNYLDFIKNSGETLPNMVVIINSYDVFIELFDKYIDRLITITRDCVRYGIYFVLTTSLISSIRVKLSKNFNNLICLQMSDDYDYRDILGKTNGVVPSKNYGRGLINMEQTVEFQTAYALNEENLYQDIKNYCDKLSAETQKCAVKIPELPDIVTINDINKNSINISNIPFGILKTNLEIASFDFVNNLSYIISTKKIEKIYPFIDNLLNVINSQSSFRTVVIDMRYIYEENKFNNIIYLNNKYSEVLNQINDYNNKLYEVLESNNFKKQSISKNLDFLVIIIGIDKFIKSLSSEDKTTYENIIKINKDINKIHYIYIDSMADMKKVEYESIYKESIDNSCGLWLGNGFGEQSLIKTTKFNSSYNNPLEFPYGYFVINGDANIVKVIEK